VGVRGRGALPRGKDVVLLGANIARQCLQAGLVDEILVHVSPVLLGDGVRLFEQPGGKLVRLKKISVKENGELTALRFAVAARG
jgi:riboflavin biosynthesis pyrimidine reductase